MGSCIRLVADAEEAPPIRRWYDKFAPQAEIFGR